jgi:hypothetical protein
MLDMTTTPQLPVKPSQRELVLASLLLRPSAPAASARHQA